MPPTKTPTTFAELEATCTPRRAPCGPAAHARRLFTEHHELSEAECVAIALGVQRTKGRFYTDAGQWTTAGTGDRECIVLLLWLPARARLTKTRRRPSPGRSADPTAGVEPDAQPAVG